MHKNWVEQADKALSLGAGYRKLQSGMALNAQWLRDLPGDDLDMLRALLESAYQNHPMWEYFMGNKERNFPNLVFTLRNEEGEIIGTRSIGEAYWTGEYFEEHARILNIDPVICGSSLTIGRSYRGHGFSSELIKTTNEWMSEYTNVPVILGDTVSRKAMMIYPRKGAWFLTKDVHDFTKALQAKSFRLALETTQVERFADDLGIRYVWPLNESIKQALKGLGYAPISAMAS